MNLSAIAISIAGFALSALALLISYNVTVATQRAFISIKEFQTFILADKLIVMPLWQNTGGTPTRRMVNHANWRFFSGSIPADFNFTDLKADGSADDGSNNQKMFLAPKSELFSERLVIPIPLVEAARKAEGILLIWGWTTYDDVFWLTSSHRTNFANVIEVTEITVDVDHKVTAGISFPQYKLHNCIDSDCL